MGMTPLRPLTPEGDAVRPNLVERVHGHSHGPGGHSHGDHAHGHDHVYEHWDNAGEPRLRELAGPDRDYPRRSFTIGIGGPVGSGKTALTKALCEALRERFSLGVVTN